MEAEVAKALKSTSNESLLQTHAALTHQIHASKRRKPRQQELRDQRRLVQQEILSRMVKP